MFNLLLTICGVILFKVLCSSLCTARPATFLDRLLSLVAKRWRPYRSFHWVFWCWYGVAGLGAYRFLFGSLAVLWYCSFVFILVVCCVVIGLVFFFPNI